MRTLLCALVIGSILLLSVAEQAEAIPAFARKYKFSCSTCHAPFPRLKAYGEEFAGRGFRLEDPSEEPRRATIDVGDPMLSLLRVIPVAVRMDGYVSWKEDTLAEDDMEWPWAFKVLSGSPITKTISYYVYYIIERGGEAGLEDAYIQFNSIFNLPVDILFGQFQVCDPMFKRELRLTRFDYEILKVGVGDSAVDLTYDRGILAVWRAPAGLDVVIGVVNGSGIGEADEDRNFDNDKYKNGMLRISRAFGKLRLGAFGYLGKEEAENGRTSRTAYFGPDLVLDIGDKWQFSAEYLERRDDDPFFKGDSGCWCYETRGGFAELHFFPKGFDERWALTALYNKVDSDDEEAKRETASLTLNALLARNVRISLEGGRDIEREATRVSFGVTTAF